MKRLVGLLFEEEVIDEGGCGHDVGQIAHADVIMDEARRLKNKTNEDRFYKQV